MMENYKMTQRLISAAGRLAIVPAKDVLDQAIAAHGELDGPSGRVVAMLAMGALPSQGICEMALQDLQHRQAQNQSHRSRHSERNG